MRTVTWVSVLLLLGCQPELPPVIDAGVTPDDAGVDAGIDAGVPDGGSGLSGVLALVAPSIGELGVGLVRCVALTGIGADGHSVALEPETPGLQVELSPSSIATRSDVDDCPLGTLPVRGVSAGAATVRLTAVLQGTSRTAESTVNVVTATGTLEGLRPLTVPVGTRVDLQLGFAPTGRSLGSLGRLPVSTLQVRFQPDGVARVNTTRGQRTLESLQRGTTSLTLTHPAAPSVTATIQAVSGTLSKVSRIRVVEPTPFPLRGGRLAVGGCLRLEVLATYEDQGTSYVAPWPPTVPVPLENLSPTRLTAMDDRFCATATGDAFLRACFGGVCSQLGFAVGDEAPVSVELTGAGPFFSPASVQTCVPLPLSVFVGVGPARHEVTGSEALDWLQVVTDTTNWNVSESATTSLQDVRQGQPCYGGLSSAPPTAGTMRSFKPAVRYAGKAVSTPSEVTITFQ